MKNKPRKKYEVKLKNKPVIPRSDWSEGSYHDTMRKAADAKRKQYGTTTTYNGY